MDNKDRIINIEKLRGFPTEFWKSFRKVLLWIVPSLIIGVLSGAAGAAFDLSVEGVTEFRTEHGWVLWLLPVAGVLIALIYKYSKMQGIGTGTVLKAIKNREKVSILLLPVMFVSAVMTHLCGGSAGREGAAIQMGGSIGGNVGRALKLKGEDLGIATMCGSSAFFSALFGTPVTAAIFVLEVADAGLMHRLAVLPCLAASLAAYITAVFIGVKPTSFVIPQYPSSYLALLEIAALAVIVALMSRIFVETMHTTEHAAARAFKNPMLRAAVGGAAVIALTYVVGNRNYNGAGMPMIVSAIENGTAPVFAFLFKVIFTAITIGFGFKGGEIVPAFFIGATLGCVAGPLLGLPAGFAAAIGLVTMFCGCTNAPLASMVLGVELYGSTGLIYLGLACCVTYLFSGETNLFGGQKINFTQKKLETDNN